MKRALLVACAIAMVGATALMFGAQHKTRKNRTDGLQYVWIDPGEFVMGCSENCGAEMPAHRVRISKGFWMGRTEVPVGAYKRFSAATKEPMPDDPDFRGRLLN